MNDRQKLKAGDDDGFEASANPASEEGRLSQSHEANRGLLIEDKKQFAD